MRKFEESDGPDNWTLMIGIVLIVRLVLRFVGFFFFGGTNLGNRPFTVASLSISMGMDWGRYLARGRRDKDNKENFKDVNYEDVCH